MENQNTKKRKGKQIDLQPGEQVNINVPPGMNRFTITSVANSCIYQVRRSPVKKTLQMT